MKVALLGTGYVATALATSLLKAGHQVAIGSRDPQGAKAQGLAQTLVNEQITPDSYTITTQQEVVTDSEVILLAIPWPVVIETLSNLENLENKTIIDATNPLSDDFKGLAFGFDTSAAEQIAQAVPEAHIVKAFNTVGANIMADPNFGQEKAAMFYCGDRPESKKTVEKLAKDVGLDPVDSGPLANARYLEPFAMLYIHLAVCEGYGSNIAFKMLQR
ncbi:MAG: NADPH-dependent F420 reductase [Pirellulaceae bacterium]|nr:NADPH-dependent F420 reductase [Pirellulaceae bacterium]